MFFPSETNNNNNPSSQPATNPTIPNLNVSNSSMLQNNILQLKEPEKLNNSPLVAALDFGKIGFGRKGQFNGFLNTNSTNSTNSVSTPSSCATPTSITTPVTSSGTNQTNNTSQNNQNQQNQNQNPTTNASSNNSSTNNLNNLNNASSNNSSSNNLNSSSSKQLLQKASIPNENMNAYSSSASNLLHLHPHLQYLNSNSQENSSNNLFASSASNSSSSNQNASNSNPFISNYFDEKFFGSSDPLMTNYSEYLVYEFLDPKNKKKQEKMLGIDSKFIYEKKIGSSQSFFFFAKRNLLENKPSKKPIDSLISFNTDAENPKLLKLIYDDVIQRIMFSTVVEAQEFSKKIEYLKWRRRNLQV